MVPIREAVRLTLRTRRSIHPRNSRCVRGMLTVRVSVRSERQEAQAGEPDAREASIAQSGRWMRRRERASGNDP